MAAEKIHENACRRRKIDDPINQINMRKIFLICLIIVGVQAAVPAQRTVQDVKKLLMHKWKITGMELNGRTIPMPEEMKEFFVFKVNNVFIDINDNEQSRGKWTYDPKAQMITTREDGNVQLHKIVKISATDLVITAKTDEGMSNLLLKKVD